MKIPSPAPSSVPRCALLLASIVLAASAGALAADAASGSVSFKTYSTTVKYGWLVRGPDEMDPNKTVLRIYLSSVDVGAKIRACDTLSCADAALDDGAMVDFGDATHLGYALRLNGELVQYSGGTNAQAFTLSTKQPNHLAGKLHIDDSAVGGGKIDAEFDLTLTRTFKTIL
jgi:opacity protein-like surface antigen